MRLELTALLDEQDARLLHREETVAPPLAVVPDAMGCQRYLLSDYADCKGLLSRSDAALSSRTLLDRFGALHASEGPVLKGMRRWPLYLDDLEHDRVKSAYPRAIRSISIDDLDAFARSYLRLHLDSNQVRGIENIVDTVLVPLSTQIALRSLNMASSEWRSVRQCAAGIAGALEVNCDAPMAEYAANSWSSLKQFLSDELKRLQASGGERIFSVFEDPEEELYQCMSFLLGAVEPALAYLSCIVAAYVDHHSTFIELGPSGFGGFLREVERYYSPAKLTSRIAAESFEIRDTRIPKGSIVTLWLQFAHWGGAYERPHEFSVRPSTRPTLVFGSGPHACVGASIARTQGLALLQQLSETRVQKFEIDWSPSQVLRIARCVRAK